MKDGETVALRLGARDLSYLYFDPGLERRVIFVDEEGGGLDADVDWLVMAPGLAVAICPSGWRRSHCSS